MPEMGTGLQFNVCSRSGVTQQDLMSHQFQAFSRAQRSATMGILRSNSHKYVNFGLQMDFHLQGGVEPLI